ncbi:GLPGLI family protein [Tenuifilum thalassicum]|nr:GLPGLI family protein [Tenuifilum thalassicum]
MRKIMFTVVLFVVSNAIAQKYTYVDRAKYKFTYQYSFNEERNNPNSKVIQDMVLFVGDKSSMFCNEDRMFIDSLLKLYENQPTQVAFGKIFPQLMGSKNSNSLTKYYVFKNLPEFGLTTYCQEDMNASYYKIVEDINLSWNICSDADSVINGYKCKKATTHYAGRDYIAWFTLDIPISDGPYKFSGLPGLIVSIHDTKNEHSFSLIAATNSKKDIYFKQVNYIETDLKGFIKSFEASKSSFINLLESATYSDESVKYRAIMRVQQCNNFVELF